MLFLGCCLLLVCPTRVQCQSFEWDASSDLVSADFGHATLGQALESIAEAMGWDVFVEPGLEARRVKTRFSRLPRSEALRRILGDLNYALLGGESGTPRRLMVYAISASRATRKIEIADEVTVFVSRRLDNEIIVQIKPGSELSIEALAETLGATIVGKVEGLNAYRLSFEDQDSADRAREQLAGSETLQISDNYTWERPGNQQSFPHSSLPGLRIQPENGSASTIVGLIDMPVQSEAAELAPFLLPGIHVGGEVPVLESDLPTHGTSMAHTVLKGVEMGLQGQNTTPVKILPVDVYGGSEATSTFEVVSGIYQAVQAGAQVINLSLGGADPVPIMEEVIDQASAQGVLFVGAAGNSPGTEPVFPAAYPGVLAVTASSRPGQVASYANTGDFVDVMVPGRTYLDFNGVTYMVNGTSASAAYVSGLAASIAAATGRPVQEVALELKAQLPKP